MEPVSLIVAVLTAGATAALQETAGGAIKDGYKAPKALPRRRLTGGPAGEAVLEEVEWAPEADTTALKERLAATDAEADQELLRVAREPFERVNPEGARVGKYNVTITGGKGAVVGDRVTVTRTSTNGDPSWRTPPPTASISRRHCRPACSSSSSPGSRPTTGSTLTTRSRPGSARTARPTGRTSPATSATSSTGTPTP